MRHILHFFPTFRAGGAQVRATSLANEFGSSFSHSVIAMDGCHDAANRFSSQLQVRLLRPTGTPGTPWHALALARMIHSLRPDLVLTYNWGAMDAVLGSLLARKYPVVHAEDGFNPDEIEGLKRRRILTRRLLLNRIECTVVPSYSLQTVARTVFRLRKEKIRLILNGIDADAWRNTADREDVRRTIGAASDTFVAGFVGCLRPEKNLPLLLEAFHRAQLRNAKLVIVGGGSVRAHLETVVRDKAMREHVTFIGEVQDPRKYFAAFDAFTLPSYTEQMPIALLEAMAAGIPIVCTDVGDCARMLSTIQKQFVVPNKNTTAFAQALRVLARDKHLRKSIGVENRDHCTREFSKTAMLRAYSAVYEGAIRSHANLRN